MSTVVEIGAAKETKRGALPYVALGAVCILWGTTYAGIRVAIETIPPFYMIALRYLISGAITLAGAYVLKARLPRGSEMWKTALCGAICIGIGNGALASAELWVPSGLAALFYSTAPFWMIAVDAILPHGKKPPAMAVIGLLIGVTGVIVLVLPSARAQGFHGQAVLGFLVMQLSAAGWTLGALLQKRVPTECSPVVIGGVQQLAAGFVMTIPAAIFEQVPHHVSARSTVAVGYLVIFGSLLGFSSFIYSVARLPVSLVSVYYFVNPIVAVGLGWVLFHEAFGMDKLTAMLIIFAGIAVVKWADFRNLRRG